MIKRGGVSLITVMNYVILMHKRECSCLKRTRIAPIAVGIIKMLIATNLIVCVAVAETTEVVRKTTKFMKCFVSTPKYLHFPAPCPSMEENWEESCFSLCKSELCVEENTPQCSWIMGVIPILFEKSTRFNNDLKERKSVFPCELLVVKRRTSWRSLSTLVLWSTSTGKK